MDASASGKCVLPWGSGTKPVSSVILVASGLSFAVCQIPYTLDWPLLIDHEIPF